MLLAAFSSSTALPSFCFPWIWKFPVSWIYPPFQFTLEIFSSFCMILSYLAFIFASPLVLSLKTHIRSTVTCSCKASKMLSPPSPQSWAVVSMVPVYWSIFCLPLAWLQVSMSESSLDAPMEFCSYLQQSSVNLLAQM